MFICFPDDALESAANAEAPIEVTVGKTIFDISQLRPLQFKNALSPIVFKFADSSTTFVSEVQRQNAFAETDSNVPEITTFFAPQSEPSVVAYGSNSVPIELTLFI
jgi:hypothetical protein